MRIEFNIGDKVRVNGLGPNAVGVVSTITSWEAAKYLHKLDMGRWDTLFPDFRDKPLYVLEYEESIPLLSVEEWEESNAIETYGDYSNCPKSKVSIVPEGSLTLV